MQTAIEIENQKLKPFFSKMYGQKLSFPTLTGPELANLKAHVETPNRRGLQMPTERPQKILALLKVSDFNSANTLDQLVRLETKAFAEHTATHGFRFDMLSDSDVRDIKNLLSAPKETFPSLYPSIQVTEIVNFLKQRKYDIKSLEILEKIDRAFDQKLLTFIRKHQWKAAFLDRFLQALLGKIELKASDDPLTQAINNQVVILRNKGITARNFRMYLQFRGLAPFTTQSQS